MVLCQQRSSSWNMYPLLPVPDMSISQCRVVTLVVNESSTCHIARRTVVEERIKWEMSSVECKSHSKELSCQQPEVPHKTKHSTSFITDDIQTNAARYPLAFSSQGLPVGDFELCV